jgi:DNA-binding transcriptional LysR family regulator
VTSKATSIHAACLGLGYAWYPEESIRGELERGALKPLPLREGAVKAGTLYLIFADREAAGPGTQRLAAILREAVARECRAQNV